MSAAATRPAPSALPPYRPQLHLPTVLALVALEAGVEPRDVVAYVQGRSAYLTARYSLAPGCVERVRLVIDTTAEEV